MSKFQKLGIAICIVGVILLIAGIFIVFLEGSAYTPTFILVSMILNTIGITLLRSKGEGK